jgi:uncharacterized membrane protein
MMYGLGLGGPFAAIFMIAIVGLVIWMIAMAIRPKPQVATASPSRALDLLADRYARGEIDTDAYRSAKATIEGAR